MNNLIREVYEAGFGNTADTINAYLCFLMEIIVGQWLARKLDIKWYKALILTVARFSFTGMVASFIYQLHTNFTAVGGGFLTLAYVYVPIIMAPFYLLMRIPWRKACDYLAITLAVFQWPIHIGCMFKCCCYGYEVKFGIWNSYVGHYTFPVQPLNCLTGLCIALFLILLLRKREYKETGDLFPILLILHGLERLFWDFARDTRKDLLGMTYAQFHAIFMVIVGAVAMYILADMEERAQKKELNIKHHRKKKKRKKRS